MLHSPLPNVRAYVEYFSQKELPALRRSVLDLTALATAGGRGDLRRIASLVLSDPLLAMRLLIHVENNRTTSRSRDITTVESAVMMVGVEPFLDIFSALPTLEDTLEDQVQALLGVLRIIARARRAAELAREFATLRRDANVHEVTVAALLHDTTDIICWIYAPTLTAQVYALQKEDRSLRSHIAQRAVFRVSAAEIQQGLVRAWGLPELLIELLDENNRFNPRVRTIQLATRIARHSSRGWDDAGLPDDFAELEALLRLNRETLMNRLNVPAQFRPALRGGGQANPLTRF